MTPIFVITVKDIIELSILGIIIVAFIGLKIYEWVKDK